MSPLTGPGPTGDADDLDVLVVGGGPVGLVAAAEDGAANHPTARAIDVRSMEWLRRLRVGEAVALNGFFGDRSKDISFATRITGHELVRFSGADVDRGGATQTVQAHALRPAFVRSQTLVHR